MSDPALLREVTADDADDVLDLVTLCDIAETGEALYTIDEVRAELTNHKMRAVGIDAPRGGLAAYAWVDQRPALAIAIGGIHIRPGGDWSVAPRLLAWARETGSSFGAAVPFHCFASTGNPALIALYDSAGGEIVRRYYRMGIELDEDVVPTTAPDDVEIRGVTEDDLPVVHTVMESAFRGQFGHEPRDFSQWRHLTIDGVNPDLGLWWLASVDGAPASALYGFAAPGTGYVDSLGTLRDFRGRGLGAALLRTSFAEFRRRGLPKASLAVDAANPTGALDLYTSVGMAVEHEDLRYSFPA